MKKVQKAVKILKRKIPIIQWLPRYTFGTLLLDAIAGITVGLTAIPQGIANAIIAGLSPEYGLYAALTVNIGYLFFGSCKDVTVGPTAILAVLVGNYVHTYSTDFAVLASFLAGVVALLLGILHFGFLVQFISEPVISGFTTSAALQIAASQLKSFFGLQGSSGNYFAESILNVFKNIKTIKVWDTILGFSSIAFILLLKRLGQGCSMSGGWLEKSRWYLSLSRYAIVVVVGMIIAYILKFILDEEPLNLVGDISRGIPTPQLPPFSTVVGNETYSFLDMLDAFGPKSLVIPFVAILESVAIAKAFSGGLQVDANQEMICLGVCNIMSSIVGGMPVTGSFTKTALNNASGVKTPAGGIFNSLIIVLALTSLTSTFYYIPKASLAGLIITSMISMIDFKIFVSLWLYSKRELLVLIISIGVCLFSGLEYGIVAGVCAEAAFILYHKAKPKVDSYVVTTPSANIIVVTLNHTLSYCAADEITKTMFKAASNAPPDSYLVIDGSNLQEIDSTIASNIMSSAHDIDKQRCPILFFNFEESLKKMCINVKPNMKNKFVNSTNISDVVDIYDKYR